MHFTCFEGNLEVGVLSMLFKQQHLSFIDNDTKSVGRIFIYSFDNVLDSWLNFNVF